MTARGPSQQHRAAGAALAVVLVWALNFLVQKQVFAVLGPAGFLFARALLLAGVSALMLCWRDGRIRPRLDRAEWRDMLIVTLVGPLGQITVVTYGIHWSTAFSSALILACGPVITLLLLRVMHGEPLGRRRMAGVSVALAGMLVFMSDKLIGNDWRAGAGDAVLLLASGLFSLYTIRLAPLVARHGGVRVMGWTTLLSSPWMLLATAGAALDVPLAAVPPAIWGGLLYAVLIAAFLGWMLWGWINAVLGVGRCAPLMYLVPPVTGGLAWATVGETFGAAKLVGAALALAGVAWSQFAPQAAAAAAQRRD